MTEREHLGISMSTGAGKSAGAPHVAGITLAAIEAAWNEAPASGPVSLDEVRGMLEAAAPHIRAAERERCAQLAEQHHAKWLEPCDADDHERGLHTHHWRPFADLLRNQPKGPPDDTTSA